MEKMTMQYSIEQNSGITTGFNASTERDVITTQDFFEVVKSFYEASGYLNDVDITINPNNDKLPTTRINIRPGV